MTVLRLYAFGLMMCLAIPFMGCDEADSDASSSVTSASFAIEATDMDTGESTDEEPLDGGVEEEEEEVFLYFQCNSTGWDANADTRMLPTAEPNEYALEFTVDQEWMIGGFDQCIIVQTDSPDGWGTTQIRYGTSSGDPMAVPATWDMVDGSQIYAAIDYAALGDYRATVDIEALTATVESLDVPTPTDTEDTEEEEEELYYYLRCNSTGWNVSADNQLTLNSESGLLELDFNVSLFWIRWAGDQCIVTQTDEDGGWGTSQAFLGLDAPLVVPVGGSATGTVAEATNNFVVRYPSLGDYHAAFDPETNELTIGVPAP